jgi:hypothetical protein
VSSAKGMRRAYREDPIKHRLRARQHYRANREKVLARKAAWVAANPETSQARCRAFRESNPDYFREYRARRRLRDAWLKFIQTCAANRAHRSAT